MRKPNIQKQSRIVAKCSCPNPECRHPCRKHHTGHRTLKDINKRMMERLEAVKELQDIGNHLKERAMIAVVLLDATNRITNRPEKWPKTVDTILHDAIERLRVAGNRLKEQPETVDAILDDAVGQLREIKGRPVVIELTYSVHYCPKCNKYFPVNTTDIADSGSLYTRKVVELAIRLVIGNNLSYREASKQLWQDGLVFVPFATIQNWVEAENLKPSK